MTIVDKLLGQNEGYWAGVRKSEIADMARLGQYAPFLMWLRSNAYYTEQSEDYANVGELVREGFVIAAFTRRQYCEISGLSDRTVTRYVKALDDARQIHILGGGTNTGGNVPILAAVGIWALTENENGEIKRRPCFSGWLKWLEEFGVDAVSLCRQTPTQR